ncbi:alpha/beta fold hydrolase [Variovorax dokdonensis]|uniref:Alpha/beta fold hydrolase n=1 Tax=Variovorax dokdonensis TaxID=344883 RepID=A0ABT7N8X6_9BURK|nr:alpha/beta fold hydrolase [Variovorax dokdonensis]MDM0044399.1 alpha/beta fold hydrolase [Variovorax dokdonensis]
MPAKDLENMEKETDNDNKSTFGGASPHAGQDVKRDDPQSTTAAPMHLVRWGTDGPCVVLVHGSAQGSALGGDSHFSRQQGLAQRGWQLLVPDRPGHGRSPDPGRPDDATLDGELVAQLLPGEGAHLVGHSYGGCVALDAAMRDPSRVRSLTLIEPAMAALAMNRLEVLRFGLRMVSTLVFSTSPIARIEGFIRLVNIPPEVRGGSSPAELERMGDAIKRLRLPSGKTLRRQLETLRAAGVPMLVVSAGWSRAFDIVCDTVADVGGGRRLDIATPHHFPQLVSDKFNDALDAFMRESDARPTSKPTAR